jgi:hypothetical protein
MSGPRRAPLAGAVAFAVAVASAGCGSGDGSPPPNQGSAIVSIGDSVASGEGNPAPSAPRWESRPCHRSATAGQTIAAREVQERHPEIGFLNYACSGASIEKGLLKPYKGIEPAPFQPGRAQIDQVRDAAARAKGSGGLAALMISIGANDAGFSNAVKFCDLVKRCWEKHFNPDFPFAPASARFPTLQEYVNARLAELPERFNRLAAALDPQVPAERVIIVDYFDPTTAADGSDCTMLFGGVAPDESRWAREHVLQPLNARVEAAADDHDWQVVSASPSASAVTGSAPGPSAGSGRWARA